MTSGIYLFSYAASEMQGWRNSMEDAKIVELHLDSDGMLFGVFDGHGGKEVAIFVERHFNEELLKNSNYQQGQYDLALQETFLKIDELLLKDEGKRELKRILDNLPDDSEPSIDEDFIAGCTANVALIKNNKIYVANAGDSRCVLGESGGVVEMSYDHKPDHQTELDRIIHAGGRVENGRVMGNLNLSRCIGDLAYKKNDQLPPQEQMITAFPDIKIKDLTPECDFLVLGCDGIWDMLTNQECVEFVYNGLASNKALSTIVEEILDRCLAPEIGTFAGLGCDNMTCIIVKLHN